MCMKRSSLDRRSKPSVIRVCLFLPIVLLGLIVRSTIHKNRSLSSKLLYDASHTENTSLLWESLPEYLQKELFIIFNLTIPVEQTRTSWGLNCRIPSSAFINIIEKEQEFLNLFFKNNESTGEYRRAEQLYKSLSRFFFERNIIKLEFLQEDEICIGLEYLLKIYTKQDLILGMFETSANSLRLACLLHRCTGSRIPKRNISVVAVYSNQYFHGGLERVVSLHVHMFLRMKYRVILVNERQEPDKEYPLDRSITRFQIPRKPLRTRIEALTRLIEQYHVDLFIHEQVSNPNLLADIMLMKLHDIYSIAVRHGLTVESMRNHDTTICDAHNVYALANRLIVLSRMEESYYRALGVQASYLPNPIQFRNTNHNYQDNEGIILWVGRLHEYKNYMAALHILKKVVVDVPAAQLVMIGAGGQKEAKQIRDFLDKHNLTKNTQWLGNVPDVTLWYRKAKIHLVTSDMESFPLSIIESKSFGIPLVTYSLPYVEILRNHRGYIEIEQDDINGAAAAIVQLMKNNTLCYILSTEAKESLVPFEQIKQEEVWQTIINDLIRNKEVIMDPLTDREQNFILFIRTLFTQYRKDLASR